MLAVRWQKIKRDLLGDKGRTLLVVLAISVGVTAFGSVFITQFVLLENLAVNYHQSQASTIVLSVAAGDDHLVNWLARQPGVSSAEGQAVVSVKLINPNGREENLNLISVPDFTQKKLNLIQGQSGLWPPQKHNLFLERESFLPKFAVLGSPVTVKLPNGHLQSLVLTGTVYDNSAIPYKFTSQLSGYISWETLADLGFAKKYNQILIAADPSFKTLADAEKLTDHLNQALSDRGVTLLGTQVNKPQQHWATDNSKAFTAILSIIGIFSLILSGFLVINTISALLLQQKKQIGVMKAIGGSISQVTLLYLVMVCLYGVLALLLAVPASLALAYGFLSLVANFLNQDIVKFYLPLPVLGLEIMAALFIPLIAAIIPIFQGAKKPIRLALSDYQPVKYANRFDRFIFHLGSGLSRPWLLALRNLFRKKGRLFFTLGTLVVAGALFISVINVRSGMVKELERILSMFDFSVDIRLKQDYSAPAVLARLAEIPYVTQVEARTSVPARRLKVDGSKGDIFTLTGLPADTPFSHPILLSGRWLDSKDTYQVVLSSPYVRDNPDLKVGDLLPVEVDHDKYNLEIIGINAMSGEKLAFVNFDTVTKMKDTPALAASYLIKTQPGDGATQRLVAAQIEDRLKRLDMNVVFKQTKDQIFSSASGQFNFMVFFLLAMAVLVAIVGGLGLAGTMSLNVLERTREIGILRSIGADNQNITRLVLIEGLAVGFISFIIAIPLSLPMTYGFSYAIGNAFFDRTLVFVVIPIGMLIWLVLISVIALISSFLPARRAGRMRIRETLAYE